MTMLRVRLNTTIRATERRLAGTVVSTICLALLTAVSCPAQDFSAKPLRVVVGFAPGGSNDIVARVLAPRVGTSLGQQVIVDNRPGANGIIAAEAVAKSQADGYTMILTGVSTYVLNPLVYIKVPVPILCAISCL